MSTTFYYVMDPMCSWCYAFQAIITKLKGVLPQNVPFNYVMGGLAPDSNEPMSGQTQAYVQQAWYTIAERTGADFNFEFWEKCKPRRSTYPACRAVIAASLQNETDGPRMIGAIQRAYYTEARNPSDETTLIELAGEIGLDQARFVDTVNSSPVKRRLQDDFRFRDRLGVQGFPALIAYKDEKYYGISMGYSEPEVVMERLRHIGLG